MSQLSHFITVKGVKNPKISTDSLYNGNKGEEKNMSTGQDKITRRIQPVTLLRNMPHTRDMDSSRTPPCVHLLKGLAKIKHPH